MKKNDRVGLINKIKANKNDININYFTFRSLIIKYRISTSVTNAFSLLYNRVYREDVTDSE
jgi:hypothetical protein